MRLLSQEEPVLKITEDYFSYRDNEDEYIHISANILKSIEEDYVACFGNAGEKVDLKEEWETTDSISIPKFNKLWKARTIAFSRHRMRSEDPFRPVSPQVLAKTKQRLSIKLEKAEGVCDGLYASIDIDNL
eukprot:TRINITY_DN6464_c0_g2_i2.p1 TRINITY_DN6464_c0_g2~~TRINITY_DN6464_c0_g2_i2.p1  ORF type:complete len:131 (+),score=33.78 TRINITY_DN6464_c0_g2_i2:70-462(+)